MTGRRQFQSRGGEPFVVVQTYVDLDGEPTALGHVGGEVLKGRSESDVVVQVA